MSTLDELRAANDAAETEAVRLQNEKDAALQAIYDQYTQPITDAIVAAAAAQKALNNAEAAYALLDRPDGEALAASLGLELPTE